MKSAKELFEELGYDYYEDDGFNSFLFPLDLV